MVTEDASAIQAFLEDPQQPTQAEQVPRVIPVLKSTMPKEWTTAPVAPNRPPEDASTSPSTSPEDPDTSHTGQDTSPEYVPSPSTTSPQSDAVEEKATESDTSPDEASLPQSQRELRSSSRVHGVEEEARELRSSSRVHKVEEKVSESDTSTEDAPAPQPQHELRRSSRVHGVGEQAVTDSDTATASVEPVEESVDDEEPKLKVPRFMAVTDSDATTASVEPVEERVDEEEPKPTVPRLKADSATFDITVEIAQPMKRNPNQKSNCSYCATLFSVSTANRNKHLNKDCAIRAALLKLDSQKRMDVQRKISNEEMRYKDVVAHCDNILATVALEQRQHQVQESVEALPRETTRQVKSLKGLDAKGTITLVEDHVLFMKEYTHEVKGATKASRAANEFNLLQRLFWGDVRVPRPYVHDTVKGTVTMQFVAGYPLKQLIDHGSTSPMHNTFFSTAQRKQLSLTILHAVNKMHGLGVCHGSITPSNILVDSSLWITYIIDFDNMDRRLTKPTVAGDAVDLIAILADVTEGETHGLLFNLTESEAYKSIFGFSQHSEPPWGATLTKEGRPRSMTQTTEKDNWRREQEAAITARELIDQAIRVVQLDPREMEAVNPVHVDYKPPNLAFGSIERGQACEPGLNVLAKWQGNCPDDRMV